MNAIAPTMGAGGKAASPVGSTAPVERLQGGFADAIKAAHEQFAPGQNYSTNGMLRAPAAGITPQATLKVSQDVVKPAVSGSTGEVETKAHSNASVVEEGFSGEEETSHAAGMLEDGAKNAQPDVKLPSEQSQTPTQPGLELEPQQELQLQAATYGVLPQDKNVEPSPASRTTAETHAKETVGSAAGAKNGAKLEMKKPDARGEVSATGSTERAQSSVEYAVPIPQAVLPLARTSNSGTAKTAAASTNAIAQAPSQKPSAASAAVKQETLDPQHDEKVETVSVASSHANEHTAASHGEKVEALSAAASGMGAAPGSVATPAAISASGVVQSVRSGATTHLNAAAASGSAPTVSASGELTLRSYEAATPRRLEVGLRGGSFGWLNVRAEMGADGAVQATLRGSVETAGALRNQAGELQSFLAGQSLQVNHVAIEAGHSTQGWAQQGSSGGAQPQQQRQQRPQADAGESGAGVNAPAAEESSVLDAVSGNLGAGSRSGMAIASTGGWLSVRA